MRSYLVMRLLGLAIALMTNYRSASASPRLRQSSSDAPWGYGQDGFLAPDLWHTGYPTCAGNRQSPIAIDAADLQHTNLLKPLYFAEYSNPAVNDSWSVEEHGHTARMTGSFQTTPHLHEGALPAQFTFQALHFHYGSTEQVGSEHRLAGLQYPLEIHLVHMKSGISEHSIAAEPENGIAVVGILCEIKAEPNPVFTTLISGLEKLVDTGNATAVITIPGFSLSNLIPQNRSYVRYLGSLTTPPCSETVLWSLMTSPLPIAQIQLEALRRLLSQKADVVLSNFRPVQSLNGRVLQYFSDKNNTAADDADKSAANLHSVPRWYFVMIAVLIASHSVLFTLS